MAKNVGYANEPPQLNISFSGCGFLGIYHIGVIQCLRENAPSLIPRFRCVAGASAGALASLVLLSNCSIEKVCKAVMETAEAARKPWIGPLSTSFDVMAILNAMFDDLLPPNIHRICNGHLHVSMTAVSDLKNLIASHFNTRMELIRALKATCFIPVWAGFGKHTYRGKTYMDGGMSNNLPTDFPGETITVSPFSGEADICPSDQREGWDMSLNIAGTSIRMTMTNAFRMKSALFPPDSSVLDRMFQGGYRDCLSFIKRRGWLETINVTPPREVSAVAMSRSVSDMKLSSATNEVNDPNGNNYPIFKVPTMTVHIAQDLLHNMSNVLLDHVTSSYAKVLSPAVMYVLALMDSLLKFSSSTCICNVIKEIRYAHNISVSSDCSNYAASGPTGTLAPPVEGHTLLSLHCRQDSGIYSPPPTARDRVESFGSRYAEPMTLKPGFTGSVSLRSG